MASFMASVSDAVMADLNAATLSQTFTATRVWVVKWSLSDLSSLRVTVVPGPATYEHLDRRRDDARYEVDIAIQKKIDPRDNGEVDPLIEFGEELIDFFRGRGLTAGAKRIACLKRQFIPADASAVDQDHLNELRAFTSVVRTTWIARS